MRRNQIQEQQEKSYRDQAKYKTLFSVFSSLNAKQDPPKLINQISQVKQQYAQSLKEQIAQSQRNREQIKQTDKIETNKQNSYESPFGKDRLIHLQKINKELSKPIFDIEQFQQNPSLTEFSRPKTLMKNISTERTHQPNSNENSQDNIPKHNFDSPYPSKGQIPLNNKLISQNHPADSQIKYTISEQPYLNNNSQISQNSYQLQQNPQVQLPPKTPGLVYDKKNNPVLSDYVSVYDQQYSHLHKQERSDFIRQLNSLNDQYLNSLSTRRQTSKQNYQYTEQPIIQKNNTDISTNEELAKLEALERERIEQERQMELFRMQENERRRQQEEYEKQIKEKIERELEEQRKLKQQEIEVQTERQIQDTGIQHIDPNAVSAAEYMNTLKSLSGSVIDMKNQFISGQQRLNYELIQLKNKAIKDIEEKQRIQRELKELEQRHQAFKVWEGEKQRQLMQALEKNAPIPKYQSIFLDPKSINPSLKKITRFKDQTQGYEYDEGNAVLSKSNLMPLQGSNDQRHLHNLKQEVPVLPDELEVFREEVGPQLNYSNPITKQIRIEDMNNHFYDYKYKRQRDQPGIEMFEAEKSDKNKNQSDPSKVLLENDRRLFELNIIDPNSEKQKIQELYDSI